MTGRRSSRKGPQGLEHKGGSTKVCIECIGQCVGFVCFSRTRERVRLTQTKPTHCSLQSTQHSLYDSPGRSRPCGPLRLPLGSVGG